MKQIEAVIFDWAGTTIDHGCMAPVFAMQAAFTKAKLEVTPPQIRESMGLLKIEHIRSILYSNEGKNTFENTYKRLPNDHDINQIHAYFDEALKAILADHCGLIEGVASVMSWLRNRNILIGSTTGYTQEMMQEVIRHAHAQGYHPDAIVCADEVPKARPYPYMIHANLATLGVLDTRAVVKVGDTLVDILEGVHAGCWSVGVMKGSSLLGLSASESEGLSRSLMNKKMQVVKQQMFDAGAHFVIEKISELPQVIATIEKELDKKQILKAQCEEICA